MGVEVSFDLFGVLYHQVSLLQDFCVILKLQNTVFNFYSKNSFVYSVEKRYSCVLEVHLSSLVWLLQR